MSCDAHSQEPGFIPWSAPASQCNTTQPSTTQTCINNSIQCVPAGAGTTGGGANATDINLGASPAASKNSAVIIGCVIGVIVLLLVGGVFGWYRRSQAAKAQPVELVAVANLPQSDSIQQNIIGPSVLISDAPYQPSELAETSITH